jgi:hypothetical protein
METKPHPAKEVKARGDKIEPPFCWQSKLALERIDKAGLRNPAHAKLVYLALTWIASNEGSSTFIVEISEIARKASVGYRTVWAVLPDLERIALVTIQRPKVRSASTYTICTIRRTNGTGRKTIGTRQQQSRADISTRTVSKDTVKEQTMPCLAGSAAQPADGIVSKKITWDAEGEP